MVNILLILISILFGSFLTRWILQHIKTSSVRVSSALTLIVFLLIGFFENEMKFELSSAFLGGTFVGMTDFDKLSSFGLLLADLLYALFFYFILPFNFGLGGALGFGAAISCLLIHTFLIRVFPYLTEKLK